MGRAFSLILLVTACVLGVVVNAACGGGASANFSMGSDAGGLVAADVRPALSSLPYVIHLQALKPPARDTAAFRGVAIGPFHTVLKFSIGLGGYAKPIPLPGIGTRFAVSNGEAGFVFNSNASEGKDFSSKDEWEEVGKMEVDIEERLCRRATGKPCPI